MVFPDVSNGGRSYLFFMPIRPEAVIAAKYNENYIFIILLIEPLRV